MCSSDLFSSLLQLLFLLYVIKLLNWVLILNSEANPRRQRERYMLFEGFKLKPLERKRRVYLGEEKKIQVDMSCSIVL